MKYLYANLRAVGHSNNKWFTLGHRDNCNYPFWLLREKFKSQGVILNTPDINKGNQIAFELHIDVQKEVVKAPTYLFLWETVQIQPRNRIINSKYYKAIFSWDDTRVMENGYIKFHLPIPTDEISFLDGFTGRKKLCCAIAGNKGIKNYDSRELYTKRIETFKWFEKYAPNDFDLYGTGWDLPALNSASIVQRLRSKIIGKFYRKLGIKPFPSYLGKVETKRDTLSQYKFSICYENVCDLPGYITEKIFDCFFAGCVPIYWGASNISDYIPQECFIDRRQFENHEGMHNFLALMPEKKYLMYQKAIKDFLNSNEAKIFYDEAFATKIVDVIMNNHFRHYGS
jgi:hypothetical protein